MYELSTSHFEMYLDSKALDDVLGIAGDSQRCVFAMAYKHWYPTAEVQVASDTIEVNGLHVHMPLWTKQYIQWMDGAFADQEPIMKRDYLARKPKQGRKALIASLA